MPVTQVSVLASSSMEDGTCGAASWVTLLGESGSLPESLGPGPGSIQASTSPWLLESPAGPVHVDSGEFPVFFLLCPMFFLSHILGVGIPTRCFCLPGSGEEVRAFAHQATSMHVGMELGWSLLGKHGCWSCRDTFLAELTAVKLWLNSQLTSQQILEPRL